MKKANNENLPLKIKGSAYALKNKEDLIKDRIKTKKDKLSLPKEWQESRNTKLLKLRERKEKEFKEKQEKLRKLRNSQGRLLLTQGEARVEGYKLPKKQKTGVPRLEAKKSKKAEKLFSKWKSRAKTKTIDHSFKKSKK